MSKQRKCPVCGHKGEGSSSEYKSYKKDRESGEQIVVDSVLVFKCNNRKCNHSWLPIDQEARIDRIIAHKSRFDLKPQDISFIREALPFSTKFQTANFLGFNEKAFTKWENGYSEPNRAYDLLLRLAVFSKENYAFINHLHKTNFEFQPRDYQLICEHKNLDWNFKTLTTNALDEGETEEKFNTTRSHLQFFRANNEEPWAA